MTPGIGTTCTTGAILPEVLRGVHSPARFEVIQRAVE
jgi:hypothetical protein